ncbi:MAG: TRAPP subunit [Alyxoria varia]|nr:MAG: TRAPP subunit [Alyxoria varia]
MSYYFAIVGTRDNPLFTHSFGTSKHGGDGVPRFREEARAMNQFIVHASLDLVEEAMWSTSAMYLKQIDKFQENYVSCFLSGTGMKFLLLCNPDPERVPGAGAGMLGPGGARVGDGFGQQSQQGRPSSKAASMASALGRPGSSSGGAGGGSGGAGGIAANPTSPATEEAIRQFFADVYETWVKTTMNPFYHIDAEIKSPAFRNRVATAAKKYL